MKIRTALGVDAAAAGIAGHASASDGQPEAVTPKFDRAIGNIAGKPLTTPVGK